MKKLVLCLLVMVAGVFNDGLAMADGNVIYRQVLFNNISLTAGSVSYAYIDVGKLRPNGIASIQVYLNDADGAITMEWEVSNNDISIAPASRAYVEPLGMTGIRIADICTAFTKAQAKAGDGREIFPIKEPILGLSARIKITNASANLIDSFTAELACQ